MRALASTKTYMFRWEVNSRTEPDKTWVVSMKHDGTWGCACPKWIFNKERPRKDCHHIDGVKAVEPRMESAPVPKPAPHWMDSVPVTVRKPQVVVAAQSSAYYVLQTKRAITLES